MKKNLLALLLACVMLALVSCGEHELPPETDTTAPDTGSIAFDISEVEFTSKREVMTESENSLGATFALNKTLDTAVIGATAYAFEQTVSDEDRADCVQATEDILNKIGGDRSVEVFIYTSETYDYSYIMDGKVYTHVQDWHSPEYVSDLLWGLFGEYCNYGMIYGYANYLCEELYGYQPEVWEENRGYEGELISLDMNLLCFRPEFVTQDDVDAVKRIANTFVSEYIDENGEAEFQILLEKSGNTEEVEEFTSVLDNFYLTNGIEHTPSTVLYRPGGCTYDYIVKCKFAEMYIEKDWVDANLGINPLVYEDFLHSFYTDTRHFFQTTISEMESYRELFSFAIPSYNDDLDIYFSKYVHINTSYYDGNFHSVALMNVASFMHEFIHSLTLDATIKDGWSVEGFATCFNARFNTYGNAMTTADYNDIEKYTDVQTRQTLECVNEFKEKLGRDIDTSIDWIELQHIRSWSINYSTPNGGNGYIPGASFIDYLCRRFGERETLEMLLVTHDYFGLTYDELVADWREFLRENYSEYTQIR